MLFWKYSWFMFSSVGMIQRQHWGVQSFTSGWEFYYLRWYTTRCRALCPRFTSQVVKCQGFGHQIGYSTHCFVVSDLYMLWLWISHWNMNITGYSAGHIYWFILAFTDIDRCVISWDTNMSREIEQNLPETSNWLPGLLLSSAYGSDLGAWNGSSKSETVPIEELVYFLPSDLKSWRLKDLVVKKMNPEFNMMVAQGS